MLDIAYNKQIVVSKDGHKDVHLLMSLVSKIYHLGYLLVMWDIPDRVVEGCAPSLEALCICLGTNSRRNAGTSRPLKLLSCLSSFLKAAASGFQSPC